MEAATAQLQRPAMTKLQKLAALFIILGPESAAHLLRNLDEDELEAVSTEMAGLAFVSQELQQEILEEFTDVAVSASTAILGGPGFARNALERSVGAMRASDIIRRVAPAAAPPAAMRQILEMEAGELFNLLKSEQPQTIALVLSHLTAEKSSRVLALLSPEARQKVVERLAMMGPTPLEVVERIAGVLGKKTAQKPVRALSQTGGVKTAAQMLNSLD
jgi:flagellar motor switch protein FliG